MADVIEFFKNLFGGGDGGDDFWGHDPDNLEIYWLLDHEMATVENGEKPIDEVLQKFNSKNRQHVDQVMGTIPGDMRGIPPFHRPQSPYRHASKWQSSTRCTMNPR